MPLTKSCSFTSIPGAGPAAFDNSRTIRPLVWSPCLPSWIMSLHKTRTHISHWRPNTATLENIFKLITWENFTNFELEEKGSRHRLMQYECGWSRKRASAKGQQSHYLLPNVVLICRAPNDAQFTCLRHTRTEIHPLQVCPVCGVDPLNLLVTDVFTL